MFFPSSFYFLTQVVDFHDNFSYSLVPRCFQWNRFSLEASFGSLPGAKLQGRRPAPRGGIGGRSSYRRTCVGLRSHKRYLQIYRPKLRQSGLGFYSTENSEEPIPGYFQHSTGACASTLRWALVKGSFFISAAVFHTAPASADAGPAGSSAR
jgi:hypothetical protein